MRKIIFIILAMSLFATIAQAGWVNGYYRKDRTYVGGHYRSNPNYTVRDNYSYKDNYNPYTGRVGTSYYRNNPSSEYYGTSSSRSRPNEYNGFILK